MDYTVPHNTELYIYFFLLLLLFVEDAWSRIQCTGTVICRLFFVTLV